MQRAHVLLVGGGGLGGHIASSLVRKGIGRLTICDADRVELSNLSRQVFYARDVHRPKALALAKNVAELGSMGSVVTGHEVDFNQATAPALAQHVTAAVIGIDNNHGRAIASQYLARRGIPTIFTAINERADFVWVFLQRSASPCVGCVFPRIAEALHQREPCREVPSSIDILKVAAGLVGYALNSVLMQQPQRWTYADYSFASSNHVIDTPKPRRNCTLCRSGS